MALDGEQLDVAREAVSAVRFFPSTTGQPHAAVIVLSAGWQESGLRNLDYGDRDSLGFLQQRPSQGWGTAAQVRDVAHATRSFLSRLVEIPGWQTRRVTDVAAEVQRPAEEYRGLYEQWVPKATVLVERLWRNAPSPETGSASVVEVGDLSTSVRLHHANLYVGESPGQFGEDLARLLDGRPDFVTLNEVYNRSPQELRRGGYGSWQPSSGPREARDTAVLWRTDTWRLLEAGSELMHRRAVKWGTRYVTWATLTNEPPTRDASPSQGTDPGSGGEGATGGQTVTVISGHAAPGGPGRDGLFGEFRTRLVQLIDRLSVRGPVLFGGDLNVQYPYRQPARAAAFEVPFAPVGAATTYSVLGEPSGGWATGTHHGGTIDYIITAGAVPRRHATTTLPHSDHRMLAADLTLTTLSTLGGPGFPGAAGVGTEACGSGSILGEAGGAGVSSGRVVYPVPAGLVSSDRRNWGGHGAQWASWHTGTDFSVPCSTPVLAAHAGTLDIDTTQPWAGPHLLKVTRGPGALSTWYAHLQRVLLPAGRSVQPGDVIGEAGQEGNATGCHLHFEVHLEGGSIYGADNVDPTDWLATHAG